MQVELRERTEENVRVYFERTRDPEIQARIPQRSQTVEQALEDYRRSLAPARPAMAGRSGPTASMWGTSGVTASTPRPTPTPWSAIASLTRTAGGRGLPAGRWNSSWPMPGPDSA